MIDENPRQVLIEARVVEVSLKGENSLGINWQVFAEKGGFKMGQFRVGSAANGALEQNIGYKPTSFPPGSTLDTDRESPFAITIFDENINLVLNTLANNYDANILSAPRVTTVNNREAVIKIVTELRWVVPQVEVGDTGGVTITWAEADDSPRDVGISLKVTPMITDDGQISMELEPEVSEKMSDVSLVAVSGTSQIPYTIPIVDTRTTKTKVVIGNKQTLIIGGLIKNIKTKGVTKIPVLGDIPVLGWLFKSRKDTNAKSELIIFVSPTIINQQEVMRMQKKEKEGVGKWYMRETEPQEDARKVEKEIISELKRKETRSE
ncbi:MAG: hypothetical protein L6366_06925 [Candidatus Omnitrophica bacterium]|nr:hypothetical protein [Candidatus Omnitrophota bacterium]